MRTALFSFQKIRNMLQLHLTFNFGGLIINEIILVFSLLCLVAAVSSKLAGRLGVPALVIFILVGILAGSDGPGKIYFDNYYAAQFVGVVALSYILFMGGLSVDIKEVRPVFKKGIALATIGVLITALTVGFIGHYFLSLSLLESMLLGSIISSTDAAAVFSVLRSKDISLRGDLKPLLEFESGSNDPMAVLLTVVFISLITGEVSSVHALGAMFIKQIVLGLLCGYFIAKLSAKLINKIHLEYNGLYIVLTVAIVAFAYSFPSVIGGNGFLSVYVCGLTLSASKFVHKKMLTKFHDGIAWFMQIIMFLILGLLVFVKEVWVVAPKALIIAAVLIFIARPLSVFITLIPFKTSLKEKLLISWVGLRGAAPIVLATFPLFANISCSHEIFNIVFFVVLISVLVQGTTIPLSAKLLGVDAPMGTDFNSPIEFEEGESEKKLVEIQVLPDSCAVGKTLKELLLPDETLVAMISREGEYHIPRGDTRFEACDILFILSQKDNEQNLRNIFEKKFKN